MVGSSNGGDQPFELVIPRKSVSLGAQTLEFRGLSFNDVTLLMAGFETEIDQVFALYEGRGLSVDALGNLGQVLLEKAPELLCMCLAIAMDVPDPARVAEQFSKAPGGFQLLAFEAVFSLTVEPAGGAKEFFGRLSSLLPGMASKGGQSIQA